MSIQCPSCASELESGAVVCVHCGSAAHGAALSQPVLQPADPPIAQPELFASTLAGADRDLEGLSGWLILVGIRLVVAPFLVLRALAFDLRAMFIPSAHQLLESRPELEGLIAAETVTNLVSLALIALLLYFFFGKKRLFPNFMILYMVFVCVVVTGDAIGAHAAFHTPFSARSAANIASALISSAIWIPYFLISRRVKVTFVL